MRAVLALSALLCVGSHDAVADGERGPMYGFTVLGVGTSRTPDDTANLAGAGVDLAWWNWRIGVGLEGSELWSVTGDGSRATVAGASLRVRIADSFVPSLIDPRDVELGVELQGIVEHRWWKGSTMSAEPNAYGVGVAVRLRGSGDAPNSTLLAESRIFLRVMASSWNELDTAARTTMPTGMLERPVTVVFGLGGSWGTGERGYADKLRLHPLDLAPSQ